jgi:hypothetical protein
MVGSGMKRAMGGFSKRLYGNPRYMWVLPDDTHEFTPKKLQREFKMRTTSATYYNQFKRLGSAYQRRRLIISSMVLRPLREINMSHW